MAKAIILELTCDKCKEVIRIGTNIKDAFAMRRFLEYQHAQDWFDGKRWLDEDLCPDCLLVEMTRAEEDLPF